MTPTARVHRCIIRSLAEAGSDTREGDGDAVGSLHFQNHSASHLTDSAAGDPSLQDV